MNKKYSVEFKLKVVRDYERGEKGSHLIAQENGIHPGMVLRWYKIYKYHGIMGLLIATVIAGFVAEIFSLFLVTETKIQRAEATSISKIIGLMKNKKAGL